MATRALILAGGASPTRTALDTAWPGWAAGIDLVIAADAGALLARGLGLTLDLVVGDGDSLGEAGLARVTAQGVAIERAPVDKDASDTELALLAAAARGASVITVLGSFGGRLDHTLANIWILAHPELEGRAVVLLDERTRVRLISVSRDSPGPPVGVDLVDRAGSIVTLLPFDGPAGGVTTRGLRWELAGATLPAGVSRGLSNEVLAGAGQAPRVELAAGRLIVIETTLLGSGS